MQKIASGNAVNPNTVRLLVASGTLDAINDNVVEMDATTGALSLALPAAATCKGWQFQVTKVDATANLVTINPDGAELINGNATATLGAQFDSVVIESDGVGWIIIAMYSAATDPNAGAAFAGVPTGSILPYGGIAAPTGWLFCDGSSLLRAGAFAKLFAAIGTGFGAADGTHFNVPDLRGRFLRGVDGSAGRDPGDATRTAMQAGGNVGDAVGSVQGFATALPVIPFTSPAGTTDGAGAFADNATAADGTPVPVTAGGDAETRPINAYVNFIIKI